MNIHELSKMITPQPDGTPVPYLRTAVVVSTGTTWVITLDGVDTPATALSGVTAAVGEAVQVFTKLGAPPLVIGAVTGVGSGWHLIGEAGEPAFAVGWSNLGSGFRTMRFRRVGDEVILNGVVKGGTATIFTLPAGFLPLQTEVFGTIGNDLLARVDVTTAGAVQLALGSATTYLVVDGRFGVT